MEVSDRRLQAQLTQEAKIASDFSFIRAIFAFVGFVSALGRRNSNIPPPLVCQKSFLASRCGAQTRSYKASVSGNLPERRFFVCCGLHP